ncbi:MAG: hypothetical protein K0R54_693 [Clostridiaceae bacterium]|jgi:hypothetical protein|nr:hypothetical protein [Clostridiaceae bacterium]
MEEKLKELIKKYEKEISENKNTKHYEDSDMYFGIRNALEDVVSNLNDLLLSAPELKNGDKTVIEFPCKVGDIVWIADERYKKPLSFKINCIKIFEDNITAHGYRESGWGKFNIPIEYSLKNFGKRVIFATKKEASKEIKRLKDKQAKEIKNEEHSQTNNKKAIREFPLNQIEELVDRMISNQLGNNIITYKIISNSSKKRATIETEYMYSNIYKSYYYQIRVIFDYEEDDYCEIEWTATENDSKEEIVKTLDMELN